MIRLLDGLCREHYRFVFGVIWLFFFLCERAHAEFLVYRAGGGTVTSSRFFDRLLSGCCKGALKICVFFFFLGAGGGDTDVVRLLNG